MSEPYKSILLLLIIVVAAPCAHARDIEKQKWIKATSDHYVIYSRMSKGRTIDLLIHLEAFQMVMGGNVGSDSIPTEIVVTGGESEFLELGGMEGVVGLFLSRLRSNYVLLRNVRGMEEVRIVLHEYGHSLLNKSTMSAFPEWYQEGYAEYLSTMKVRKDKVEFFNFPQQNVQALYDNTWLPARKLIAPPTRDRMSKSEVNMFYAQSWALVHFLLTQEGGSTRTTEALKRYAYLQTQGIDKPTAFEQSFELDLSTLNERLRKYVFMECCRLGVFSLAQAVDKSSIQTSRPSKNEVAITLARMSRAHDESEAARRLYSVATEHPEYRDEALAGVGSIADKAGEREAAAVAFAEIREGDPIASLDLAFHYERLINRTESLDEIGEVQVKLYAIIDALKESGYRSPEFLLLAARHTTPERALTLTEEAYLALPENTQTQSALILAYSNTEKYRDAITFARIFKGRNFDRPDFVSWLDNTIDTLESRLDTIESFSD